MKVRYSPVDALRALSMSAVAALLLVACAGAPQPEPRASASSPEPAQQQVPKLVPTVQPANLDAVKRFAWQQVVQLGESVAAGDAEGFLARVSRGFYRNYSVLEGALKTFLANTSARSVVVAISMVAEEEGRVSVTAKWTRTSTEPGGGEDARYGETVFLFLKSDTSLRLLDYRGDAPFALEGI